MNLKCCFFLSNIKADGRDIAKSESQWSAVATSDLK